MGMNKIAIILWHHKNKRRCTINSCYSVVRKIFIVKFNLSGVFFVKFSEVGPWKTYIHMWTTAGIKLFLASCDFFLPWLKKKRETFLRYWKYILSMKKWKTLQNSRIHIKQGWFLDNIRNSKFVSMIAIICMCGKLLWYTISHKDLNQWDWFYLNILTILETKVMCYLKEVFFFCFAVELGSM